MAIKIEKFNPNGIVTTYHRIPMVIIETNQQTTVLVYSYLSEEARLIEKDASIEHTPQYYEYEYHHAESDNFMTIEKAYEWLKTQPEFIGAEDV